MKKIPTNEENLIMEKHREMLSGRGNLHLTEIDMDANNEDFYSMTSDSDDTDVDIGRRHDLHYSSAWLFLCVCVCVYI